jgi:hypothetical protein
MKRGNPAAFVGGQDMISKTFARSAVVAAVMTMASGPAAAEDNEFGRSPSLLEGSWEVTIKPHNCVTGVETPPQAWNRGYLTFNAGGTLLEATSARGFQPGQRGPGHGHWERVGVNTYEAVFQAFILFSTDPPGVPPNPNYTRGPYALRKSSTRRRRSLAGCRGREVP